MKFLPFLLRAITQVYLMLKTSNLVEVSLIIEAKLVLNKH